MIGEQTVTCRYKATGAQEADIEIQMTVSVERRAGPLAASVEIGHRYDESQFAEETEEEFFQRLDSLNNGVHGGYGNSNVPYLPDTVLTVMILHLKVSASPQTTRGLYPDANLGYMLEMTISGIVETLLRSMENLRTGKQIYGPDEGEDGTSDTEGD